jgi:hypothetical protein
MTWDKDPAICEHDKDKRFVDYKDASKIEWCGDCGKELSEAPDLNHMTGQTRKDELEAYFRLYANEAKVAEPRVALLSLSGWVQSGRPTFEQYHRRPKLQTPEGDKMTDVNTNATETTKPVKEKKEKAPRPPGAKALVRQIFAANPNAALTIEEIAAQTGKPASSITTAISDLKSTKYCKPGDPLKLYRHSTGKYSLVEEVKPAETSTAAAAGTQAEAPPLS